MAPDGRSTRSATTSSARPIARLRRTAIAVAALFALTVTAPSAAETTVDDEATALVAERAVVAALNGTTRDVARDWALLIVNIAGDADHARVQLGRYAWSLERADHRAALEQIGELLARAYGRAESAADPVLGTWKRPMIDVEFRVADDTPVGIVAAVIDRLRRTSLPMPPDLAAMAAARPFPSGALTVRRPPGASQGDDEVAIDLPWFALGEVGSPTLSLRRTADAAVVSTATTQIALPMLSAMDASAQRAELERSQRAITGAVASDTAKAVVVQADGDVPWTDVVRVLDALASLRDPKKPMVVSVRPLP